MGACGSDRSDESFDRLLVFGIVVDMAAEENAGFEP
jgi:hypothetical protein